MARVTVVNKSMKDQTCGRCGKELPKGSAYRWAKPGFRSRTRLIRCMDGACSFRPSDLCTSNLKEAYAAQELLEDAASDWGIGVELEDLDVSDLETAIEEAKGMAEGVRELYEEANSSWEENSGSENYEFTEKVEALEAWESELEDTDFDDKPEYEGPEDPGEQAEGQDDHEYEELVADYERAQQEFETELEEWADACRDAVVEAAGNLPV